MRQSKLFYKTLKELPHDAQAVSHKLFLRAGFIEQLSAGIYNFLPLGYRVLRKIENIIREEINNIDGQEVFLATLQPKKLWVESGRWNTMDPPLFKCHDRHNKELALGSTHEEVMTNMVRSRVSAYRDLPFALYQIQNKFRNEMRATGGLLRVREFIMKDLYSFHASKEDLDQYYLEVIKAYQKIFERCGLKVLVSQATSGTIGGDESHEFQLPSESGEDRVLFCPKCSCAINKEVDVNIHSCSHCQAKFDEISAIEVGHIFKLGTLYSEKMGAYFIDKDGSKKPIVMGCYGIGLGRLMAAIIESDCHHDERGMVWPDSVAPFQAHLIVLDTKENSVREFAEEIYKGLKNEGLEVLFDDRKDVSVGEKFGESDLIGIPVRLVVSKKSGGKIEYKRRDTAKMELLDIKEIIKRLKK